MNPSQTRMHDRVRNMKSNSLQNDMDHGTIPPIYALFIEAGLRRSLIVSIFHEHPYEIREKTKHSTRLRLLSRHALGFRREGAPPSCNLVDYSPSKKPSPQLLLWPPIDGDEGDSVGRRCRRRCGSDMIPPPAHRHRQRYRRRLRPNDGE